MGPFFIRVQTLGFPLEYKPWGFPLIFPTTFFMSKNDNNNYNEKNDV